MKFTLSWLKAHLETDASAQELAEALTSVGLELESLSNPAEALENIRVGYIESAIPHPNADRLKVCIVNVGNNARTQVVCGGVNARAGIKVAFAPPGTHLPAIDITLKATKIRGTDSLGMLCSDSELGLSLGTVAGGILELDQAFEVGTPFSDAMGLNDPLFEIGITPNRGDCLGVRGIARDLAAKGLGTLKPLSIKEIKGTEPSPFSVSLSLPKENAHECPVFTARLIKDVDNNLESPKWLQQRLNSIGHRSISPLVDITNFILFDLGRPLHVFDADKVKGNITIRKAKAREQFKALDEETYALSSDDIVIADDVGPISLGGIMGGLESGCTETTKNVILESAWFDPIRIATSGRKHSLLSDSRYRFERTVDPDTTLEGAYYGAQLILEICGGRPFEIEIAGTLPKFKGEILFDFDLIQSLTGVDVTEEEASTILVNLGFQLTNNGFIRPNWRSDVEGAPDLVEEILRIKGLDHIPTLKLPPVEDDIAPLSSNQIRRLKARHAFAEMGYHETVTFSMLPEQLGRLFSKKESELVEIANPITLELSHMRPSILPNLLSALKRNKDRNLYPVSLFELGPDYQGPLTSDQRMVLAGIRSGEVSPSHWSSEKRNYDIFDLKNDVNAVLSCYEIREEKVQYVREGIPSYYHPGRSAAFKLGHKNTLGFIGEIHPKILGEFDIDCSVVACEIFLDNFPETKKKSPNKGALHLSPYQPVERDFAVLMPQEIEAGPILPQIKKVDPSLIDRVSIFDLYQGKGIEEGKKSVGFRVHMTPQTETLTDEKIQKVYNDVLDVLTEKFGATLRS